MYTRRARLDVGLHESNMLYSYIRSYNWLVQQENVCIHDATGCTTGCKTGCTTGVYRVNGMCNILFVDTDKISSM